MNIMFRLLMPAFLAISIAGPWATVQAAPLPTELQGKVAAQVDPFLLLRNLARLSPETFNQLLEQAIAGLNLPDIVKNPLDNLIANAKDPEEIIDFIENADKTLLNGAIRQAISQYMVFNRDQILALIPNLPQQVKDLLAALLPETIDLNQIPLAMTYISVLNKSGWPLWFGSTNKDGDYKLKLPNGAVSLRFSHMGYQEVTVPVGQAVADGGKIWLVPSPGNLQGTVYTGSGFRRKAIQNAKVTVQTSPDAPNGITNRWGLFSLNASPLLPGLLGGIGVHRIEVDAEDYYLETKKVIFLAGSSMTQVEVREAPPMGRLSGLVRYSTALLGALKRDNADIKVLNASNDVIATGKSLSGTGLLDPDRGTYAIPPDWTEDYLPQDKYIPKGTYRVEFSYEGYPTVINSDVVIRSARETTSDACLNGSLKGTVTDPLKTGLGALRSGVNVRVMDGTNIVAQATTVAGIYAIDIIPGGTYRIEFRNDPTSTNPDELVEDFTIPVCESKTLDKGVYGECYYQSYGSLGGYISRDFCTVLGCVEVPRNNADVRVIDANTSAQVAQGSSNALGLYGRLRLDANFAKIPSGTYNIQFRKSASSTNPDATEANYSIPVCGEMTLNKKLN